MTTALSRTLLLAEQLQELARKLPLSSVVRLAPKFAKLLVCLLFLLNIRSWPLVWHFRVFRPAFARRFQHKWVKITSLFKSPAEKVRVEARWLESIAPIGQHPFKMVVPYNTWASIDDSDFNGHLSNSSYAKTLDSARFKTAVDMFPMFFPTGGWMALAATHYHFIREVPILSSYEVRTSIAAWDQKWLYVMSKVVCKSKGKKRRDIEQKSISPSDSISSQIMALRTPGPEGINSTGVPSLSVTPKDQNTAAIDTENALNAVVAGLSGEEPDGATLHTIIISQICFKVGRITVPPQLVLGVNGFTGAEGYSAASPHPQWANARKQMLKPYGGNVKKLKELFVGGWREVPEGERWWDHALGEAVETQRLKNLVSIEGLRKGLEAARAI
ncbi:hypothetical protein M413DRAFT_448252 [Hebeloma cylindrosporum]|uniref:Thioesterase domain-containing protein n=1 Tax=Hebeloma cylindrosporum TaxID=76867 RepID=A0A0C3BM04_HEBCY|nr:hypothetical protein M413DRAFT_448252 [Hebeloma cylindrosporum h7]